MEQEYFEKAIHWAEKQGFSNIKANFEDYEAPVQFNKPGEDQPYIPDITGVKTGGKSYVEIALKSDNMTRKVSKWKLLSTLASRKGGKFFLLAPRGHKAFTQGIVERYNLDAKIVSI